MNDTSLYREICGKIREIVNDSADSIENRLDRVIALQDSIEELEKKERLRVEAACFEALIEMLIAEHANLSNAGDLLELYALLAETYVELNDNRPVKDIAYKVRDIIRCEEATWEALEETVPRIIDAVNDTVYNHASYDLTLMFLRKAFKEGKLDEKLKGRARRLLKLRILLEDPGYFDGFFSKELEDAIAALFSSDELMKIIMNPSVGTLRCDPVEYTFRWENIYYEVERRLDERFANAPRHMGFCFKYWNAKRELLKEEYGIDWKSPSQMNPRVMFD
ncbi:MAG: hypothetical protein K2H38_13490 [Muribaculaceae bacterium]|nr:hypothetical protein [Muribaculaceae bacterium]